MSPLWDGAVPSGPRTAVASRTEQMTRDGGAGSAAPDLGGK
jgi:hypothetical protein